MIEEVMHISKAIKAQEIPPKRGVTIPMPTSLTETDR